MTTTSTFRILKSSWGIWIQITGTSKITNEQTHTIKSAHPNFGLSPEESKFIEQGFKWITGKFDLAENTAYQVNIDNIQIADCDFQAEGLFYAIAFWVSEHFGFEMPQFRYSFNKEENRYEFPDLDDQLSL